MLARNAVHIASPQLSGNVEQLEVWFAESGGRGAPREERGTGDGNPGAAGAGRGTSDVGQGNPAAVPFASPAPASNSRQHFEIAGRVLRARVLLDGPNSGLSHLEVEDGVQFRETQTSQPGQRPLLVRGDRLEIAEASGPKTKITILGRFARFEARGLGLTGTNIHFDRGGNTVRIDGPGQMDLPMAGGLTGQGDTPGGTATVDWQGGMLFDGQTAKFTGGVVAASPNQKLWTDSMDVQLERGVHFSEATPAGAPPQVEAVRCFGGVRMENQTRDPQGQLTALDRMHVSDIDVNLLTGALNGGPGELVSVRHGSDRTPGAMPFGQNVALRRPPSAAGGPLKCLHVVWQGAMVGNVKSRTLRFRDQVQAGYAPVDEWERSIPLGNPDQLGPDGATVNCGQLTVAETITPLDSKKSIELEALGNAQAENATFKAVANRITYAEAKDLLILEGDGRSDANLFRQDRPGDPPTTLTAQKVWFWPKTNRCKIENPKALQIIQFQPGKS
jgi:hypothetical protein